MRCQTRFSFSYVVILVFLMIPTSAYASSAFLNDLFHPFQYLDISSFYNAYHYWVDFFIFLCLFVSVAKLTLGRRFEGKEGRVLSMVVGLILALSLSLAEYRFGFSIKSFGSIAAAILIFLVGLVIFYLIKSVGAGSTASGSLAFIIAYLLVRAAVPEFFSWLEENGLGSVLNLVLIVALFVSIWKFFSSFWSGRDIRSLGRTLEHIPNPDLSLSRNIGREKQDFSFIKRDLEGITKGGVKDSKDIVRQLREMVRIIDEYGATDKGRRLIAEKINQIAPKENLILKQLAYLKGLSERIEDFDLKSFKDLRSRWDNVPENERKIVREEVLLEKNKIVSEEKLKRLESQVSKYDTNFRYCLNMAISSLKSNQPNQAKDWLAKAIRSEEETQYVFEEMKNLEDKLLKLTRREFKTVKMEQKDEKG